MKKTVDWDVCSGLPTRCYRNLNNGLMSLQQKVGKSWLVVGHTDNLILKNVTFYVSEASRQRVIANKRKNVHAWASGTLERPKDCNLDRYKEIYYCPFSQPHFTFKDNTAIVRAASILVTIENHVFCPFSGNNPLNQLALF
jgi:hypothetical protein